jgi:hypothetical protein
MKTKVFLHNKIYTFYSPIHGIVNLSNERQVRDYITRYNLPKAEYITIP